MERARLVQFVQIEVVSFTEESAYMNNEGVVYTIEGTLRDIEKALISDFGLQKDEAKFLIFYEIESKRNENYSDYFTQEEIQLWYMQRKIPSTFQVLNKPYSITVTDLGCEAKKALWWFLVGFLFTGEITPFSVGISTIQLIADTIKKIEYDDYCVYGMIVENTFKIKEEFFLKKNIIPYTDESKTYGFNHNICNRKPEGWVCPHHTQYEACTLKLDDSLKRLESLGIIKHSLINKDEWRIVK